MADEEELRKTTLNLYATDVEFFKERFGEGWSTEVRRIMRREVQGYQAVDRGMGDFDRLDSQDMGDY